MVGETAKRELLGEFPNEIIRASAGTGKTFALSNRYLKLLASGAECQTILATTFTKKGAGEILDRIVNRLSDAALDERAAERLSRELGGQWKLSRQRAARILHELMGNLHRLEISTLDSFFNRVAKVFALELGLPPTWEIVDEQEINRLHDIAIQTVLNQKSVVSLLHMLSKGEAGRRVASMIRETVDNIYGVYRESGPEPWDQLPVTGHYLPNEKLEALSARVANLDGLKPQLTKHWAVVKGFAQAEDWAEFASTKSFQNVLDGILKYGSSKLPQEILDIYQQMLPHCRAYVENRLISQNQSTRDLLAAFGELLEKNKDDTGQLRFDDVTERLQQFVSMWDTERFSFRLDHQIQHLLLDEFQDTSLAQWNVIRPFAKNVTQDADTLRSFFCVGDMKQAIFGWRGGVAEIFDLVDDELPNLDETQPLTASYRSSQPVIDLVNNIFSNVKQYTCKDPVVNEAIQQWPNWFAPHTTERNELKGHITIEMASDCDQDQKRFEDSKDRARNNHVLRKTIKRIRDLVKTIPAHHSIGVIVRTNQEVADLIFRLQRAQIPASEEGGSLLTDSAAVEIILSAIQLADHPGDSIARFHLSHSPLAGLLGLEPETSLNQSENEAAARIAAADLRQQLISVGYGPTIESLARNLSQFCTKREVLRLQHLVRVAYDRRSDNDQWRLRPSRFVQFVREEVKVSDQSSARVRVMTIHKAKGLEFDVVVLPIKLSSQGWAGMTPNVVVGRDGPTEPIKVASRYVNANLRKLLPGNFQAMFDGDRQRNVREAMCVLYVALTRAVHSTHIVLSHGAKPDHQSQSGILLATLCPNFERHEGILYERGEANWFESTCPEPAEDPFELESFYLPERLPFKPAAVSTEIRSGRGVPRTNPSRLEGGDEMRLGSLFETHENLDALTRGRMLHGCLEKVTWLDEATPKKEELEAHLRTIDSTIEDFDHYIAEFYRVIENDNVRKLLSRSTYQETYLMEFAQPGETMMEANRLELHNERRFAVQLDSGLLEGTIDRLILVYQGNKIVAADIIDFKSDCVSESTLQQRIEYYRPQLGAYRDAVSQFARIPIEKVSTRLVFMETGQVVNLDLVDASVDTPLTKVNSPKFKRFGKNASAQKTDSTSQSSDERNPPNSPPKPNIRDQQQKTFWD